MKMIRFLAVAVALSLPVAAHAQDAETLADIRQQLTVLYSEIQYLKRELSTTGPTSSLQSGGSTLERIDVIEAELKRLTGQIERVQHRVQTIVDDGTNRIGDLEFRLVELEGGDVSTLGETTTLGGAIADPVDDRTDVEVASTELAIGERADFDRALAALSDGHHQSAADQFAAFTRAYPGSPLESEAHLRRGQALEGLDEVTNAARAYLESYSGNPSGQAAPEALFFLGASLGKLDQVNEACVTLGEVGYRYPGSAFAGKAQYEMQTLGCS